MKSSSECHEASMGHMPKDGVLEPVPNGPAGRAKRGKPPKQTPLKAIPPVSTERKTWPFWGYSSTGSEWTCGLYVKNQTKQATPEHKMAVKLTLNASEAVVAHMLCFLFWVFIFHLYIWYNPPIHQPIHHKHDAVDPPRIIVVVFGHYPHTVASFDTCSW